MADRYQHLTTRSRNQLCDGQARAAIAASSTSADELHRTAGRLADWVAAHEDVVLPDLAYT
jgi:polyketide synthase 5